MAEEFETVSATTLALLQQFQATLSSPLAAAQSSPTRPEDVPPALPLLADSSATLKAQVTKLSLLALNSPFTHSAVNNVLRACNDSVLPSVVTAALLVTPTGYTKAFHLEILHLAKTALLEFATLIQEVNNIAEHKQQDKKADPKKKEAEVSGAEKNAVTLAVGRVWDACDAVNEIAQKGVVGFVMRRVEQWRDLVRDAVEELEDWDPEEDGDELFDDLMDNDEDAEADDDSDDEEDSAALHEQKKSTLRFLKPIAQVYPAIINYRLKNIGDAPLSGADGVVKLESLMLNLQGIPDQVDEAAGSLYENNLKKSIKHLQQTQKHATQAVTLVTLPWKGNQSADDDQQPKDKFTVWSKTWLKVMEEVGKSIDATTTE
ncbi:hypothetical protein N7462_006307 [Penicillium macrosclerotiorum]|uniref:uncharacterized protein n=1 Tax=Penicillium macrosclerotiorum TaxID=303699 RepID=UPI0025474FB1|nr:uncharacterized protein N7462_006307 [Penicillium macrosclerotiorum]KAJ5683142.1 hypothetical protein N7462_006307 [Penicillium macrosclerotiorum]